MVLEILTADVLKTRQKSWNCASWNDGCNTCQVENGVIGACTLMTCLQIMNHIVLHIILVN